MPTKKPDPSDRPNEYVALPHHEGHWYYVGMPGSGIALQVTSHGTCYERADKLRTWFSGTTTVLYLERSAAEDLAAALNHGRFIRNGGTHGTTAAG